MVRPVPSYHFVVMREMEKLPMVLGRELVRTIRALETFFP